MYISVHTTIAQLI